MLPPIESERPELFFRADTLTPKYGKHLTATKLLCQTIPRYRRIGVSRDRQVREPRSDRRRSWAMTNPLCGKTTRLRIFPVHPSARTLCRNSVGISRSSVQTGSLLLMDARRRQQRLPGESSDHREDQPLDRRGRASLGARGGLVPTHSWWRRTSTGRRKVRLFETGYGR